MAVSPSSPLTERELQQYAFGIGAFSDNEGLLGQEPIVERLRGFCTGSAHGVSGSRTAAVWGPPGAGASSAVRAFVRSHEDDRSRRAAARAARTKTWKAKWEGGKMVRKLSAASSDDEDDDEDEDDADGAKTQDWSFELIYHAACASVTARRERGVLQNLCEQLIRNFNLAQPETDDPDASGSSSGEAYARSKGRRPSLSNVRLPLADTSMRALRVLWPRLLEQASRRTRTLVVVVMGVHLLEGGSGLCTAKHAHGSVDVGARRHAPRLSWMLRTPPPNIRFVVSLSRNAALPPDLSLGLVGSEAFASYGRRCARPAPPLRSEVSQQACVECTDLLHALRERHQTPSEIQMLRAQRQQGFAMHNPVTGIADGPVEGMSEILVGTVHDAIWGQPFAAAQRRRLVLRWLADFEGDRIIGADGDAASAGDEQPHPCTAQEEGDQANQQVEETKNVNDGTKQTDTARDDEHTALAQSEIAMQDAGRAGVTTPYTGNDEHEEREPTNSVNNDIAADSDCSDVTNQDHDDESDSSGEYGTVTERELDARHNYLQRQQEAEAAAMESRFLYSIFAVEGMHEPLRLRLLCGLLRSRRDTRWLKTWARARLATARGAAQINRRTTTCGGSEVATRARWAAVQNVLSSECATGCRGLVRQAFARVERGLVAADVFTQHTTVNNDKDDKSGAMQPPPHKESKHIGESEIEPGGAEIAQARHSRSQHYWCAELLLCSLALGRGGEGMLERELEAIIGNCTDEWSCQSRAFDSVDGVCHSISGPSGDDIGEDNISTGTGMTRAARQRQTLLLKQRAKQRKLLAKSSDDNSGGIRDSSDDCKMRRAQLLLRFLRERAVVTQRADGLWQLAHSEVEDEVRMRYSIVEAAIAPATARATMTTVARACAYDMSCESRSARVQERAAPQDAGYDSFTDDEDTMEDASESKEEEDSRRAVERERQSLVPPAPSVALSSTRASPKARALHELIAGFFILEWLRDVGLRRTGSVAPSMLPSAARTAFEAETRARSGRAAVQEAAAASGDGMHAAKGTENGVCELRRGRRGAAAEAAIAAALLLASSLRSSGRKGPSAEMLRGGMLSFSLTEDVSQELRKVNALARGGQWFAEVRMRQRMGARQWHLRQKRIERERMREATMNTAKSVNMSCDRTGEDAEPGELEDAIDQISIVAAARGALAKDKRISSGETHAKQQDRPPPARSVLLTEASYASWRANAPCHAMYHICAAARWPAAALLARSFAAEPRDPTARGAAPPSPGSRALVSLEMCHAIHAAGRIAAAAVLRETERVAENALAWLSDSVGATGGRWVVEGAVGACDNDASAMRRPVAPKVPPPLVGTFIAASLSTLVELTQGGVPPRVMLDIVCDVTQRWAEGHGDDDSSCAKMDDDSEDETIGTNDRKTPCINATAVVNEHMARLRKDIFAASTGPRRVGEALSVRVGSKEMEKVARVLQMPTGLRQALGLAWKESFWYLSTPLACVDVDDDKNDPEDEGDMLGEGVATVARRTSAAWAAREAWPPLMKWAVPGRTLADAIHRRYCYTRPDKNDGEVDDESDEWQLHQRRQHWRLRLAVDLQASLRHWIARAEHKKALKKATRGRDDWFLREGTQQEALANPHDTAANLLRVVAESGGGGGLETLVADNAGDDTDTDAGTDEDEGDCEGAERLGDIQGNCRRDNDVDDNNPSIIIESDSDQQIDEVSRPTTAMPQPPAESCGAVKRWLRLFEMLGHPNSAMDLVRTRFAPLASAIAHALEGASPSVVRSVARIIAHEGNADDDNDKGTNVDGETILRMVLEAAALPIEPDSGEDQADAENRGAVLDGELLHQLRLFGSAEGHLFCHLTHARPFARVGVVDIALLLGKGRARPLKGAQRSHVMSKPPEPALMAAKKGQRHGHSNGGDAVSAAFDRVENMPGMTLSMRGQRMTAFEAGVLAHYLPANQRLRNAPGRRKSSSRSIMQSVVTALDLRDNPGLGPDGLRTLAEACLRCPLITRVTIDRAGALPVAKLRGDDARQADGAGRLYAGGALDGDHSSVLDLSEHELDAQEIRFMAVMLRANKSVRGVWLGGVAGAFERASAKAMDEHAAKTLMPCHGNGRDVVDESDSTLEGLSSPVQQRVRPPPRPRSVVPLMPGPLPVQWIAGARGVGAPKVLDFSGGGLALQEAVLVAELLKPNLLLTDLRLARNDLDAPALEALTGPLSHHDMLVALDLSDNGFGPRAVPSVAQLLSANGPPRLQRLICHGNHISSDGRRAIGQALLSAVSAISGVCGQKQARRGRDHNHGRKTKHVSEDKESKGGPSASGRTAHHGHPIVAREFLTFELDLGFGSLQLLDRTTILDLAGRQLGPSDAMLLAGALRHTHRVTELNVSSNRLCGVWVEGGSQIGRYDPIPAQELICAAGTSATLQTFAAGGNVLCGIALTGAAADARARKEAREVYSAQEALAVDAAQHAGGQLARRIKGPGLWQESAGAAGPQRSAVAAGEFDDTLLLAMLSALRDPLAALQTLDLSCNALFGVGRFGAGEVQPAAIDAICAFIQGSDPEQDSDPERHIAIDAASGSQTSHAQVVARDAVAPSPLCTLVSLDISNNYMGSHGGLLLASALRFAGRGAPGSVAALHLVSIDARCCGIGVQAGAAIADALYGAAKCGETLLENERMQVVNGLPVRRIRLAEVENIDLMEERGANPEEHSARLEPWAAKIPQKLPGTSVALQGLRSQALAHRAKPLPKPADEADLQLLAALLMRFPGKLRSIKLTCTQSAATAKPMLKKVCKSKGIDLIA